MTTTNTAPNDIAMAVNDDTQGIRIANYRTGGRLVGVASEALIEASDAETARNGTGAVCAYQDAAGVWQHVPDHQEDFYRRIRGEDVITVYVER